MGEVFSASDFGNFTQIIARCGVVVCTKVFFTFDLNDANRVHRRQAPILKTGCVIAPACLNIAQNFKTILKVRRACAIRQLDHHDLGKFVGVLLPDDKTRLLYFTLYGNIQQSQKRREQHAKNWRSAVFCKAESVPRLVPIEKNCCGAART